MSEKRKLATMAEVAEMARRLVAEMPDWKKGSAVNERKVEPPAMADAFHAGFMAGRYGKGKSAAAYAEWRREHGGQDGD